MRPSFVRFANTCAKTGLAVVLGLSLSGCGDAQRSPGGGPTAAVVEGTAKDLADAKLRDRIDATLDLTNARHMDVQTQYAWQVLHGVLVYGRDLRIYNEDKQLVSAIDYLLAGGQMRGWNLRPGDHGVHALLEPGSKSGQGHKDQWIGYMALSPCQFPLDYPVTVGKKQFTFGDLITQAQWECTQGMEASWTLMSLSAYVPMDAKWKAADGGDWDFERLIAMEAANDIKTSACGGTHRLVGMTVALNRHLQAGGKLEGGWLEAEKKIQWAIKNAQEWQQPSGAFSTSYFDRAGSSPDAQLQIGTTGHTLEFLAYALTDEQIQQPWMAHAADFLCGMLERTQNIDLECGAVYHAAAGLYVYRMRRFGPRDSAGSPQAIPTEVAADLPPVPPSTDLPPAELPPTLAPAPEAGPITVTTARPAGTESVVDPK